MRRSLSGPERALLLVARRFFFFGQLVVPDVIAKPQFGGQRLGLSNADFPAFFQKLLNKRVIGIFLWNIFHALKLLRKKRLGNGSTPGKTPPKTKGV